MKSVEGRHEIISIKHLLYTTYYKHTTKNSSLITNLKKMRNSERVHNRSTLAELSLVSRKSNNIPIVLSRTAFFVALS